MARIVRCGVVQATNETAVEAPLEKIKSAMLEKHLRITGEAAQKGVRILSFQEMFTGPYFCAEQDKRWYGMAERIPDGPTVRTMQEVARSHGIVLVVPIYEEEITGVYYNTAAVIDGDGRYLGKYRKHHIPHCHPGFWEKFYFMTAIFRKGRASWGSRERRSFSIRRPPSRVCPKISGSSSNPRMPWPTATS